MFVLAASPFNPEHFVPIAVFAAFAIGAWAALNMFASKKPRATERCEEIKTGRRRKKEGSGEDGAMKKQDAMTRLLSAASPALARPLQPKDEKEANKLKLRLGYAGFRGETAPTIFLGFKF